MPEFAELQNSDIVKILEGIKKLQGTLADDSENIEAKESLFNSYNYAAKYYLERFDIPNAIVYLRGMEAQNLEQEKFCSTLGWDYFHTLKAISCDEYSKRHYTKAIPEILNRYASLNIERPSQIHSAIMSISAKLSVEQGDWFISFVRQFGFDFLQESDFQHYSKDGRKITPLAETIFLRLARVIESGKCLEDDTWLYDSFEKYAKKFSENYWICYYHAKLLLKLNKVERASIYIKELLTRFKNQFWVWALYGETFKNTDKKIYLACLAKALSFPTESTLLLNIRVDMAMLLNELGYYAECKTEVETIILIGKETGAKVSNCIADIVAAPWYEETKQCGNILAFYFLQLPLANQQLAADSAPKPGIVTASFENTKGVFVQFDLDKVALYKYGKSENEIAFAVGDLVQVTAQEVIISGQKRYEALTLDSGTQLPPDTFIRSIKGELKIQSKPGAASFGFVTDVYVPPDVLKEFMAGSYVEGIAVKEFNKKRGQYGWRGVILKQGTRPVIQVTPPVEVVKSPEISESAEIAPSIIST